jgi:hypothetical protein
MNCIIIDDEEMWERCFRTHCEKMQNIVVEKKEFSNALQADKIL